VTGLVTAIGIISGLKRELRCLGLNRPPHVVTFAAAGSTERAHARARGWLVDGRVRALMSFGICGGLDPGLAPGTVLVAHRIALPEGGALHFDARWARAVAARIPGARIAPLLGTSEVVTTAREKAALFARFGVPAVDMESRGVAEAAREANVPFVAVRAVADPADRSLPPIAIDAINAEGRLRPLRVLLGLLGRPRELAGLLALATDARRAYDALTAATNRALQPDLVPSHDDALVGGDAGVLLPDLVPQTS
jgi:adenosylhomocysteine nucleosidase